MAETTFFFSEDDPSVMQEVLRRGYCLVAKKHYDLSEDLFLLTNFDHDLRCLYSYYVLPDRGYVSRVFTDTTTKKWSGKRFYYIMDRVGAASIALILPKQPREGEVCVGSVLFEPRTYASPDEPLKPLPPVFAKTFRALSSYIKRTGEPIANSKFPKTVYVFPRAMALLREDPSRSPWPSVEI